MLPVSLDSPFIIDSSGFCNLYLLLSRIKIDGLELLIIVIMLPVVYQTTKNKLIELDHLKQQYQI